MDYKEKREAEYQERKEWAIQQAFRNEPEKTISYRQLVPLQPLPEYKTMKFSLLNEVNEKEYYDLIKHGFLQDGTDFKKMVWDYIENSQTVKVKELVLGVDEPTSEFMGIATYKTVIVVYSVDN